jgi:ubiquinone/menaquinone biosynthesis C-methylase UbiE
VKAISNARSDSDVEPSDSHTEEVLREWRESAFYWQKHHSTIRTMFQPVTQALIDDAAIVQGQSVLDVAGGSGEPSLTIAKIIGSAGSVTYTDAVAEMVAAAENEAQRRGLTNVAFQQCSANSLPFESKSFDAVVCRMGAMFFPDPLAALREMLRVTKEGGAISLAVWEKAELNPFSYAITNVVNRHFDGPPGDPNAPGAFRFAESGVLAGLLRDVRATNVKERVLKFHIAAPISPQEFWEMRSETSGTLREKLTMASANERNLVAQEAQEAVREFFPNNQMNFPAQMIIVTGTR